MTTRYNEFLGTTFERTESGEVACVLELADHHRNKRGVAHGGVVASLLDSALGGAVVDAIPKEWWCATVSLAIQFVSGARGSRLVATGRVIRFGRRVAFAEGQVRDDAGRVVATAQGSWHVWNHRPGVPDSAAHGHHVVVRGTGERMDVGKIVAVGRNYAAHIAEMGGDPDASPPVVFFKPSTALVADGDTVELPRGAGAVHHEVELVAVIGKPGRRIPEDHALDHVLGYAVGVDLTLRDVQSEAKRSGSPWALAKGFDGSAPVSAVAPREEVGDGAGLAIRLAVDGETRQEGSTDRMIRSVARIVAHVSRFVTLERGDLVFTGTPEGVGPVVPGNRVEAEIERVGRLTFDVVDEPESPAGA